MNLTSISRVIDDLRVTDIIKENSKTVSNVHVQVSGEPSYALMSFVEDEQEEE